jgi:hypothetical protein
MYIRGFHEVPAGQKFADCEFGFDKEFSEYFLSTKDSANSGKEACVKGERRLSQVMAIFVLYTGIIYDLVSPIAYQIAGEEPFIHTSSMVLGRTRLLPILKEEIEKIAEWVKLFDGLSSKEYSTKRIDKAINYFLRGCYLEHRWRSESFLNFFKIIELISHDFGEDFSKEMKKQLTNTMLMDLTDEEISDLQTQKRLVKFVCDKLGIKEFDVPKIVKLRHEFSAHASVQEPEVSNEDFAECKGLSIRTLVEYAQFVHKRSLTSTT